MTQSAQPNHAGSQSLDLSTLAWVIPDLRKSLPLAVNAARQLYLRQKEHDSLMVESVGFEHLQDAKRVFHQARIALEMIGQNVAARLLIASGSTIEVFSDTPAACTEDAVLALENAQVAIVDYLEALLKGRKASALGLFPQYRALLEGLPSQRIHPADLWLHDWPLREVQLPDGLAVIEMTARIKAQLGQALLKLLNTHDCSAAADLKVACISMSADSGAPQLQSFWLIAGGFFEACEYRFIPLDVYAKRTASQILQQFSASLQVDGTVYHTVARDAAFFCLRAVMSEAERAPLLKAVLSAYETLERPNTDYNQLQYGLFGTLQMESLRRRLAALSESWSALVGGDFSRSDAVLENLDAVAETLRKINHDSTMLLSVLRGVIVRTTQPGAKPNPPLALEVATTLLYLEAIYEGMEPSSDANGERIGLLVRRLKQVSEGETPPAVEPWMEALYRRLSERQRLGSVTSELRVTLIAVETALDKYLRDPLDTSILALVSGHLSQMHGVFSVLGLQQATNAVFKIREILDMHLFVEKHNRPIPLQLYEQIVQSVSTMGFLIDMLSYQIEIAKEMFVYDAQVGEFRYLNGRGASGKKIVLPIAAKPEPPSLVESSDPPPVVRFDSDQAPRIFRAEPPTLSPQLPMVANEEDDGKEILDIFLDEATSVVQDAQLALPPLGSDPAEFEHMLLIRRAFHTLKGGARMVGLDEFGAAAWAFEQMMNQWMAEHKKPTDALLALVTQALVAFSNWLQAIKQGQTNVQTEALFRASADAMRLESRLLPLEHKDTQMPLSESTQATRGSKEDPSSHRLALVGTPGTEMPSLIERPAVGDAPSTEMQLPASPSQELLEAGMLNSPESELFKKIPVLVSADATVAPHFRPSGFPEALFEIFISETSEWAERLLTCVSDWTEEKTAFNLPTVQNLAHSIRGNSGSVGFQAIAELAQAIEEALAYVQGNQQPVAPYISLLQEAASALLGMIRSCADRRTPQANPSLVARLRLLWAAVDSGATSGKQMPEALLGEGIHPGQDLEPTDVYVHSAFQPASAQTMELSEVTGSLAHAAPLDRVGDKDDPLLSEDQLDYDLLPVFLEEGAELMPALGTALRQWVEHPEEAAHRAVILRILHTLKGSGRLTGAFRLGELAHRMESGIEQLPSHDLSQLQLEPFLARFDRLHSIFQVLGQGADADHAADIHAALLQNSSVQGDTPQASLGVNPHTPRSSLAMATGLIRVRTSLIERLVDEAGEVAVYRSRTEAHLAQMGNGLGDLGQTLDRLALQLRELELQADMRIQSRNTVTTEVAEQFDPLEFDRFTRLQEIARMMTEAVGDISTVRRNVQTALYASQQDLEQQSRQLRELQRDLLRMRLVDFDVIADRLYSVVRQTAKELGKQVTLDLEGGNIELDRSVLERMTPSFEHLLRNALVHGIESAQDRQALGKPVTGAIKVSVSQEGNDVAIHFSDDGRGLSMQGIRDRAQGLGLINQDQTLDREAMTRLLFMPGFTTATQVTELAGRGIGLDVVLSDVNALGGRIETQSEEGQGTRFKLVLPLTTAVTQVLMFRAGAARFGIPAGLVETVIRVLPKMLESAYADGQLITEQGHGVPFYGSGPLLQIKQDPADPKAKTHPVLILRSAGQGLALHVDEVLGNREVVVKNMGPQLSRLPGLAGITVLPSGETTLIYNPIALAKVYGDAVRKTQAMGPQSDTTASASQETQAPLILVVDDALTVRRVIQRLLLREGYRVALANDGVHALQVLEQQRPLMVLSDIEMPRMDGFELARSIRSRPEYADLPIVMITSRIAQKHRDHAMSLGVNHYLGKPYSESELLGLIRDQVQATSNAAALLQALNV